MQRKLPKVGMGVFVIKDNKFIMGCRKGAHGKNSWSVPGGHLEFGENLTFGAAREVREETGLEIKNIEIVGITNDIFKKENIHYITIWFTSHWKSGIPRIIEPDKFISVDWYNFDNLPKNLFLPWKELLKSDFLSNIKRKLRK